MTTFIPKTYQQSVLDSVATYFEAIHSENQNANTAFYKTTQSLWNKGVAYSPIAGFPAEMPYFCLRVPTGGGKTWLAAKSVALVNTLLLRSEYSVILWLVPSKAIREQTLRALKNREHPYYSALKDAGAMTVLDLSEAKSLTRATLETSTVVIVSTVQAFRREDTEGLKVYESNGALMQHFANLTLQQRDNLLQDEAGTTPCSLANVLRLRRPFIVVDEAHNNRTPLSFDTLAKFNPSGIMELTATPDTTVTPSNVLHSVSAAELKGEEMIKLPIVLKTEPNWQQCLADAIARRDELQALADLGRRKGASYLRPVILIQGEPRKAGVETRDVDKVREELITNHNIPPEEIVVATGEEKGLEEIDAKYAKGIADELCPIKYVITQKALAEGWDCPSAYILVSMATLHSSTAVEQLLGRILRQPEAKHREHAALNQSYAFVASRDFADTAAALRDSLVSGAGFDRKAAAEFVAAANPEQGRMDYSAHPDRIVIKPVVIELTEKPDMKSLPKALKEKVTWNEQEKSLTIAKPLNADEEIAVKEAVQSDTAKQAIGQAAEASRTVAIAFFQTPAELGVRFAVPQMALNRQGDLQLFDDPEVLDYPWDLSIYDAAPTLENLRLLDAALKVSEGGEIDIDAESGKVTTRFLENLQRDLGLAYVPEHWDDVKLAVWLCKNIPETSITHASKQAFVAKWLQELFAGGRYDLAKANRQKFLIRNILGLRIKELRLSAVRQSYQDTLFGDGYAARVQVNDNYQFVFHPQAYAPSSDYDKRTSAYGSFDFRKHYYGRIGDFDSKEEFECAVHLDILAQKGEIEFWVRNLVRKESCSFFLQKADGRFYPDFLCQLKNGKILVVEYKGGNAWGDAKDDRLIGGLWAELSGERCHFVMLKNKEWEVIDAAIKKASR
jgi:type III restriction enzyme